MVKFVKNRYLYLDIVFLNTRSGIIPLGRGVGFRADLSVLKRRGVTGVLG